MTEGRDVDHSWRGLREQHERRPGAGACGWPAPTISYTIYTSGTTGRPKGVQRDTGGYAVALAASMEHIFLGQPGETYFSAPATSAGSWATATSSTARCSHGMATILYEGLPIRGMNGEPDAAIWWSLVEKYKVTGDVLARPPRCACSRSRTRPALRKHDLTSLRALYLAGEPLDEPTAQLDLAAALGVPIIDNYWQTESGWPILTIANGVERKRPAASAAPASPMPWLRRQAARTSSTGERNSRQPNQKGVVVIEGPHAPGLHADGVEATTRASSTPTGRASRASWSIQHLRLGHPRRRRLLLHPGPHRRRHQRGRPPPGHARDRGEPLQPPGNVAEVAVVGVADAAQGPGGHGLRGALKDAARAATDDAAKLQARGRAHEGGGRASSAPWRARRACAS
jgi:propionyl-CoA synthetase